ncbi:hypothetical protein H4W33_000799 [Kibdelosporangium phytohabitans]|nr:hypothetical protein [Kibdelosporangium phytohabitans]
MRGKRSSVISLSPTRAGGTLTAWRKGLDQVTG